jgi:hypothetical protein
MKVRSSKAWVVRANDRPPNVAKVFKKSLHNKKFLLRSSCCRVDRLEIKIERLPMNMPKICVLQVPLYIIYFFKAEIAALNELLFTNPYFSHCEVALMSQNRNNS